MKGLSSTKRLQLQSSLVQGIAQLNLSPPPDLVAGLLTYLEQLLKWNQVYNFTAVKSPQEMVTRHLLDSLSSAPYLVGKRILDLGTGPGLPGVPLSLYYPQKSFALLDSNQKRMIFLKQVVHLLGLSAIELVHHRALNYHPEVKFDHIITRAFASLAEMIAASGHLLAAQGSFLAMKGTVARSELDALPVGYQIHQVIRLVVPNTDSERHLIEIKKVQSGY
jgi:16S rRNA (guanine527-N7)-methyltransferase